MAGSSCSPPRSVSVKGYWRNVGRRRKRRKPRSAPTDRPYFECVSNKGQACGVYHRTLSGALRHARALNRRERAYHARYKTRKNKLKVTRWEPERRTP